MNKLVIQAEVVQIEPLRYTPAGIPLLSVVLRHVSEQIEAGMKRKVECEVNAVVLGDLALKGLKQGVQILAQGFLAKRSLKSTQLVMHINDIKTM
ncbi:MULTISPECIES: primosomal replication protein N [Methylotenera]|uniref:Replication restart protein PriB n=1 Tax=Methylotenera mobilis TaxID=359408 RepID=A0A351RA18_9PROT|nr:MULTISPECIES: primosomal replication protein N [Methylotenera]MDP3211668.1 primosomal replication protein N [Methylotenera sp.]MDP3776223.1 primosomal replication protein N [Methylotenera sp.]HBA08889.1 primosomal replication protein N [Methylotenera mobilis]